MSEGDLITLTSHAVQELLKLTAGQCCPVVAITYRIVQYFQAVLYLAASEPVLFLGVMGTPI